MAMKLIKRLSIIFCVFSVIISLCLYSVIVYTQIENYMYMFPKLTYPSVFISYTLVNSIFPIFLIILTIILAVKRKAIPTLILGIILVPILIFFTYRTFGEALANPSFCSCTTNVENLGTYDKDVETTLYANPVRFFPDAIPKDAKSVDYIYYYQADAAEKLYIGIQWSYADATQYNEFVATIPFENDLNTLYDSDSFYENIVIVDKERLTVGFVITTLKTALPNTVGEVIKTKESLQVRGRFA